MMRRTILAILVAALLPAAWAASDETLDGFNKQLSDYVKMRSRIVKEMGALSKDATPHEIEAFQAELAMRIREARVPVEQGVVFDKNATSFFQALLKPYFQGKEQKVNRDIARQGNPAVDHEIPDAATPVVRVNEVYPHSASKSTVPAVLLQVLPKLPDDINYAFVGQTLILLDTSASNIIIDYVKGVAPGL